MARSKYIYIVKQGNNILGAWTVKHELDTYLKRYDIKNFKVLRLHDSQGVGEAWYSETDITEDFIENEN